MHDANAYVFTGNGSLPPNPLPVQVTDRRGRMMWTVSIPPELAFPLRPTEYAEICSQSMQMSALVAQSKNHRPEGPTRVGHAGYYSMDPYFMDVAEAEEHGILSTTPAKYNAFRSRKRQRTCTTSLTYVLERTNAGLGNTLMMLWMAYGLAQKEGRAFFIDDTNWAYGSYSAYFAPPPIPDCQPPARTQILPCPHQARHLLVSAATTSWTFGHAFEDEFEDPYQMRVMRQEPIFHLARAGYEALFHLPTDDAAYVAARKAQLQAEAASPSETLVGMHVRHGDRHPWVFEHHEHYIPLEDYFSAALAAVDVLGRSVSNRTITHATILLASDDPTVYTTAPAVPANPNASTTDATISTVAAQSRARLDGELWKGGFTDAAFQALVASDDSVSAHTTRDRLIRSYLLDLKVLGEASEVVVCAVSALGCRLLAVMMGWRRAVLEKGWQNVDGEWDWTAIVW
ncbi:MAG: hypothetical protein M1826_003736 [Phylliscum demangeonii]|nr:MAG: hypothetical protein M1826_003736 [Phylliscum demangeonii]